MATPAPVPEPRLLCLVSEAEKAVMVAAARQFADSVSRALGRTWTMRLGFGDADAAHEPADLLILSFLGAVTSGRPIAEIEAYWDRQLADRAAPVVIPTLYRYVADPSRRAEIAERCRRLNLLAIRLSRRHGAEIADVDRVFSRRGAEAVGSDYRCEGETAALLAGQVLAEAMLGCELAPHLSIEVQMRALTTYRERPEPMATQEGRTP